MPKKTDRRVPLPAGLIPLLDQQQLETYYDVSDWQVLQWIKQGMPVEPFAGRGRRFDLAKCAAWHAENASPDADRSVAQLASAG
jgi:phage terminase Nu1 subunit (DNA packaging protein)